MKSMDYLLSRDSFGGNRSSFVVLFFRFFCGLMMIPYGYGKIVNYEKYAADFFGDPIGLGDIPSLWLTIFAQVACPIALLLGFQVRLSAFILWFNMLVAVKYHFFDPFSVKALPLLFLGLYSIQVLLGAGRYSLDYLLYAQEKGSFSRSEGIGLLLFVLAFVLAWFVFGNCFSGFVSSILLVLIFVLLIISFILCCRS